MVTNYNDSEILADVSFGLGRPWLALISTIHGGLLACFRTTFIFIMVLLNSIQPTLVLDQ